MTLALAVSALHPIVLLLLRLAQALGKVRHGVSAGCPNAAALLG